MPPINNFTTKAKEAIKRAHELAIERGQNHVNPLHLLVSLIMQEDSPVSSILERLEVDIMLLTENVLDALEVTGSPSAVASSYQLYLTPDRSEERRVGKECRSRWSP